MNGNKGRNSIIPKCLRNHIVVGLHEYPTNVTRKIPLKCYDAKVKISLSVCFFTENKTFCFLKPFIHALFIRPNAIGLLE